MEKLGDFVSVPITETYTSLLQGAGGFDAGGAMSGLMDISIYDSEIWTALMSGIYSGPTGDSWNLQLQNGPDIVDLSGSVWSGGEWLAGVEGTVDKSVITGEAAGTYGGGEFVGVGAGTVAQD